MCGYVALPEFMIDCTPRDVVASMVYIQEPEYEEHVPPFSETLKLGEIANEYDSYEMQVHQQLHDFTVAFLEKVQAEQKSAPFAPTLGDNQRRYLTDPHIIPYDMHEWRTSGDRLLLDVIKAIKAPKKEDVERVIQRGSA